MKRVRSKYLRKICSAALSAFLFFGGAAPVRAAEAEGFELQRSSSQVLDRQLVLTQQRLQSLEDGSPLAEYYYVYTPGSFILPMASYGSDIRGAASYSRALEIESSRDIRVIGGTNGDFFTVENGICQGICIRDGIVRCSEDHIGECIAFDAEGRPRIGRLDLDISLYDVDKDRRFSGLSFNKALDKSSGLRLFSADYGESNAAAADTYNVWILIEEGGASLGGTITGTIEEVFDSDEAHSLDQEHLLLSIYADTAYSSILPVMRSLEPGDRVEVSFNVAEGWEDVRQAIGGGQRLLKDGEVQEFSESGKAPRTAAGITEDGKLILYAADGRQKDYSEGLSYAQLAQRLKDLGAVDAINLDGGGSTQLHLIWPGYEKDNIINKPTESRRCANYLVFAVPKAEASEPERLYLYRPDTYILAGSKTPLTIKAIDKDFNGAELPGEVSYSFPADAGIVEDDQFVSYRGFEGTAEVSAFSGGLQASTVINIIGTPEEISILDAKGNTLSGPIRLEPGQEMQLKAAAKYKGLPIKADPESFSWETSGAAVTVTGSGIVTASEELSTRGAVIVKAGDTAASLEFIVDKTAPEIEWYTEGNRLCVAVWDGVDETVASSRIKLKLDGEKTEYSYDPQTGELSMELPEDELLHHIIIEAGDEGGNWRRESIAFEPIGFSMGRIFSDMDKDHWATKYVEYLNRMGILNGKEKGDVLVYNPENNMSRQEFAAVMIRMLGIDTSLYEEFELSYSDIDSISSWAVPSVKAATALGIMEGKENGDEVRFDPLGTLSRQQAFTVIGRIVLDSHFGKDDLSAFGDAEEVADWAMGFVQNLAAQGMLEGFGESLKPAVPITRAEVAKIIFECR